MKQHLEHLLQTALKQMLATGELLAIPAFVQVEPTKDRQHGDFATNIAMILAKPTQKKPCDIAERIIQMLPASPFIEKVEIAGPGFINIFVATQALNDVVVRILREKENFARSKMGREKRVLVEFVSSIPTGPLHIGHGRLAVFGAVIANLLQEVGFLVFREYYINDGGRQMDVLAVSIWLRYMAICGEKIQLPPNAYHGDYVTSIAQAIFAAHGRDFCVPAQQVFEHLPQHLNHHQHDNIYLDTLIKRMKSQLGERYQQIIAMGAHRIMADIRDDLTDFGIHFDTWVSQRELTQSDAINTLLSALRASGNVYERQKAMWLRSSQFGDEKDRVLIRANGEATGFAQDAAYHLNKFDRGFDIAINIFGADHYGYVNRMKAGMQAATIDPERLIHILVQFVTLYRQGKKVPMSTRRGDFISLRQLRTEVGNDAARFFYVMRSSEQPMDFDVDLARAKSIKNPYYYVQYAYTRIVSVFHQLAQRHSHFDEQKGLQHLALLTTSEERQLLHTLARYPDIIVDAALHYAPHLLTNYLRELAGDFHVYYNAQHFIVADDNLCQARLALIAATKQVLANGFRLLDITPLESM